LKKSTRFEHAPDYDTLANRRSLPDSHVSPDACRTRNLPETWRSRDDILTFTDDNQPILEHCQRQISTAAAWPVLVAFSACPDPRLDT